MNRSLPWPLGSPSPFFLVHSLGPQRCLCPEQWPGEPAVLSCGAVRFGNHAWAGQRRLSQNQEQVLRTSTWCGGFVLGPRWAPPRSRAGASPGLTGTQDRQAPVFRSSSCRRSEPGAPDVMLLLSRGAWEAGVVPPPRLPFEMKGQYSQRCFRRQMLPGKWWEGALFPRSHQGG